MLSGSLFGVGNGYSTTEPVSTFMEAILLAALSVNHTSRVDFLPFQIAVGSLPAVGTGYSVMTPDCVSRPILFAVDSVNQKFLSAPSVTPKGPLLAVGVEYSANTPVVVRMSIFDAPNSATQ